MLKRLLGRLKIKSKLILIYSVLLIVSTVSASSFTYHYSRQILVENSTNSTLSILDQTMNAITDKLQQIDDASDLLLSNQVVRSTLQFHNSSDSALDLTNKINSVMSGTILSNSYIAAITMYDFNGHRYRAKNIENELPFAQARRLAETGDGSLVWGGLMNDSSIIPAIKLIFSYDMKPIGVLVMYIYERSINKLLSEQLSRMSGVIYIVDGSRIISSANEARIGGAIDDSILQGIRMEGENLNQKGYFYGEVEGRGSLITFYPSKVNQWKYICIVPMSEIERHASKLWKVNALFAFLGAIVFILITMLISNTITKPINRMARRMKEVHIGERTPLQKYEGNDEIAYLSEAFQEMIIRINKLVEEVYEQKLLRSQQELKALQAQINPHFLYNTLEVVNWMARSGGAPQIGEIVLALSGMMRYSIGQEREVVTVAEELKHVRNYLTIQSKRFGDKLTVRYKVDERVLKGEIIKLTLQPIVENAIAHGFRQREGRGEITVTGFMAEGKVCIRIADDGVGIAPEALRRLLTDAPPQENDSHSGIGMNNVNKRIKIKFGKDFGLRIDSRVNEGTIVDVWLPPGSEEEAS